MTLLFDITSAIAKENKVSNTDFEDYYPNVNANTAFKTLKPNIRKATNTFILKYIDSDTYERLATAVDLVDVELEVLELLKQAVAEYTIYLTLPKNLTILSDMGAVETTNDNTQGTSIVKMKMTRWSCICDGDAALDQALQLMEENLDVFTDWAASEQYTSHTSVFFKTTSRFEKYANISGRRAFLALLPHVREADKSLKDILCEEYDTIAGYLAVAEPSALQLEMIDNCRSFIANKSMLEGLAQSSMIFAGDKYTLASNTESYDTRSKMIATWINAMPALEYKLKEKSSQAEDRIVAQLYQYPETFTLWDAAHQEDDEDSGIIVSDGCVGAIGIF